MMNDEKAKIVASTPKTGRVRSINQKKETAAGKPVRAPADTILLLQQTIGNQAVQRLFASGAIQAKLVIGGPGDEYELEADRVAEEVMGMSEESMVPRQQRKTEGRRLLAHELTRVAQHDTRLPPPPGIHARLSPFAQVQCQELPKDAATELPGKGAEDASSDAATEAAASPQSKTREITYSQVEKWINALYGIPYGYSGFTKEQEYKKSKQRKKELEEKIASIKTQIAKMPLELLLELENATIKQLESERAQYWEKDLMPLIKSKIPNITSEIMVAIKTHGVVCDIFVQTVMRMTELESGSEIGTVDVTKKRYGYITETGKFPLTNPEIVYNPQTEKIKDLGKKAQDLSWAEKMLDWAINNDEVFFDYKDPNKKSLPFDPIAGDIIIFGIVGAPKHVNFVIEGKDKRYYLAGARSSGKLSGAIAFTTAKYSEKLAKDILLRQDGIIMYVIRPKYKPEEPPKEQKAASDATTTAKEASTDSAITDSATE